MKTGICPSCGSDEVYMQNGGVRGHLLPVHMVRKINFLALSEIYLDAYLCIACGHVELAVPEERLQEARLLVEKWNKVKS